MMADAKETKGWSFAKASLIYVFSLQALLQFIVCLPVQVGQLAPSAALGPPTKAGKVLDTGLWRYTRHPNYFGDACAWWGIYLVAAETGLPGALTIVGPILLTFLLTRVSGVPTTEGSMRRKRPDYEAYVARTSGFIPMPPKRGS